MDQWVIDAILLLFGAIVGTGVGRFWEKIDRRSKKDREQIDKIVKIISPESEALQFLRGYDFGNPYRKEYTEPFWKLKSLLSQPSYFFINRKLEKAKKELQQELTDFQEMIAENMFLSDRHQGFWELANPHDVIVQTVLIRRSQGEEISGEELAQLEKKLLDNHDKVVKKINLTADNICKKYDILISIANRIL